MIYEATVSYKTEDDKVVKDYYVIENAVSFSDAEETIHTEFEGYKELDVESIRRSKIKEIANTRSCEDESLWVAEMMDVFHDDEGNEKPLKYKILFFSKTYESANSFISEYSKQGYDMSLVSLKLTKFSDVL